MWKSADLRLVSYLILQSRSKWQSLSKTTSQSVAHGEKATTQSTLATTNLTEHHHQNLTNKTEYQQYLEEFLFETNGIEALLLEFLPEVNEEVSQGQHNFMGNQNTVSTTAIGDHKGEKHDLDTPIIGKLIL